MRKLIHSAAVLSLVTMASSAVAQTNDTTGPSNQPGSQRGTQRPLPPGDAIGKQDRSYVANAAQTDIFELRSSQLALERSRNPDVRNFAEMMVRDHTSSTRQLKAVADRLNIDVPTEPNALVKESLGQIQNASADGFDRAYIDAQVTGHQAAVANTQLETIEGQSPEVRNLANQLLPTVRDHLTMVQGLQSRLGATATR